MSLALSTSPPAERGLALVTLPASADANSPLDCVPQERFNAMLHLETEVFFHGVKGCSRGDAQSTRAAHIVRLQPNPR